MATATKIPLASITLSSATDNITISGIPQTYTDLRVVVHNNVPSNGGYGFVYFNNTDSNCSDTWLYVNASTTAVSARRSNASYIWATDTSINQTAFSTWDIMSYSNTTTYKTMLMRNTNGYVNKAGAGVGMWRSTAAITSFTLYGVGMQWGSGTKIDVYGIL